jgi:hypothetical protein
LKLRAVSSLKRSMSSLKTSMSSLKSRAHGGASNTGLLEREDADDHSTYFRTSLLAIVDWWRSIPRHNNGHNGPCNCPSCIGTVDAFAILTERVHCEY